MDCRDEINRQNRLYAALAISTVSFLMYLFSLFPSIHFDDNPELVGAAFNLGTAHPSGYPVYLLLSKFFSFFPIGTIAFKANLLSAIVGSVSLAILFLFFVHLSSNILLAFLATITFSLSSSLWSQSITGEVYTLHNFFISLIWYCSVLSIMDNQKKYLLLAAFFFGLGMTNHITLVLIVPSLVVLFFFAGRLKDILKCIFPCVLAFLLGYSTVLYTPLRAMANPEANWFGNTFSISHLFQYIFIAKDQNIIYSQVSSQQFPVLLHYYREIAFNYVRVVSQEFPLPLFIFLPLGVIFLWKREKNLLWFSFSLLIPFFVLFLLFCDPGREESHGVFVIPSFISIALWIGSGIYTVTCFLYNQGARGRILSYGAGVLLFIPAFYSQFQVNDQSENYLAHSYGKNILNTVPYKGRLNYRVGTQKMYLLFYLNEYTENYRNDILYGPDQVGVKGGATYLYMNTPIYNTAEYTLFPAGLLYRLSDKKNLPDGDTHWPYYFLEDFQKEGNYKDAQSLQVRAEYYYFQAENALSIGDDGEADRLYGLSIAAHPGLFFEKGKKIFRDGNHDRAREMFLRLTEIRPDHDEANYNLGILAFLSGDIDSAIERLEKVKKIDEVSIDAYYILGKIFYGEKNNEKARYYWKKYMRFAPSGEKRLYVKKKLIVLE